jgi:hypothetical protein
MPPPSLVSERIFMANKISLSGRFFFHPVSIDEFQPVLRAGIGINGLLDGVKIVPALRDEKRLQNNSGPPFRRCRSVRHRERIRNKW